METPAIGMAVDPDRLLRHRPIFRRETRQRALPGGRKVPEPEVTVPSFISARPACRQARKILCVHYLEKATARLAIATSYSGFLDNKRHQLPQDWLDRDRKSASVMDNRLSQLPSLFLALPLFAAPSRNH